MHFLDMQFIAINLALIFAPAYGDFMFHFKLQHSKYVSDSQCYATLNVSSRLACGVLCASDPKCIAFYASSVTGLTGNRSWMCGLVPEQETGIIVSFGRGTYGYLHKFSFKNIPPPPELTSGVFEYMTRTPHGLAAVYDCSSAHISMTNLALLYKHDINGWPDISPLCAFFLCSRFSLAASVLDISYNEPDNLYHAKVFCQNDEFHGTDATCDVGGLWILSAIEYTACISTKCYRNTFLGRSMYRGTKAVTTHNVTCQRWDTQLPQPHITPDELFILDGYSQANANNYCRSPDGLVAPWCYQASGVRFALCDIPRCMLPGKHSFEVNE